MTDLADARNRQIARRSGGEKPAWFDRVWRRITEEVASGRQAYVVCPRIGADDRDDNGDDDRSEDSKQHRPPLAVLDIAPQLAEGPLRGLRLGVLHGRLPTEEKDVVMRLSTPASSMCWWPPRSSR